MWREATVDSSDLKDIQALEKKLGGRIMDIRPTSSDKVLVRYAPVVDSSWFVEIWEGKASLCLIDQFGFINALEDAFAQWDKEALQRVIDQVMKDYEISLEDTGQYYPISQEAQEAFKAFLARAKRKPRQR